MIMNVWLKAETGTFHVRNERARLDTNQERRGDQRPRSFAQKRFSRERSSGLSALLTHTNERTAQGPS